MPPKPTSLHFDIHPSVVFQLGRDLITDEVQALIEMVKNCYDAGATYAKVEINTRERCGEKFPHSLFPDATGYVAVTDDGEGMSLETIQSGWLIVSNSAKRRLKATGDLRKQDRTPLGDKGLGRLASQRLGNNVEVFTTAKGTSTETHVGFEWNAFHGGEALSEVPIRGPFQRSTKRKRGTTVLVSGLSQPQYWEHPDPSAKGRDSKQFFEQQLASLVSPFEEIENFTLHVSINGMELDPARISRQLRQEADVTFAFEFDGETLQMSGKTKLRVLEPSGTRSEVFSRMCQADNGVALLEFLQARPQGAKFQLKSCRAKAWYVELSQTGQFSDLAGIHTEPNTGTIANPGPFRGEVDGFSLDRGAEQEVFSSAKEYKDVVKGLVGVFVFRDGFGLRVDHGDSKKRDFLGLGEQWTSGRSYYGLKPANTVGFIAISARDNPRLEETTDREGFKDNIYYRNFRLLLNRFVQFSADALQFLRRETLVFCDEHSHEAAQVEKGVSPKTLAKRIGVELTAVAEAGRQLKTANANVAGSRKPVQEAEREVNSSLFGGSPESRAASDALQKADEALRSQEQSLSAAAEAITNINQIQSRWEILETHIADFEDRLSQAYEMMGVGLTAEALAHEIRTISDNLDLRTAAIGDHLKQSALGDNKIAAYVRHVKSSVAALRKELGHLDPSLKYARHQREDLRLDEFLSELKEYREGHWRDDQITLDVKKRGRHSFDVHVNRGKLTQIFDNLITNAEYWLEEDLRLRRINKGVITIQLESPLVWISDNGRGIDPSVEDSLFEPFVTTKPDGRGLGLFVVNEFLKSEGCRIGLSPQRNSNGRLNTFELDLSGMIHGERDA